MLDLSRGVPGERSVADHAQMRPQFPSLLHRYMAEETIHVPRLPLALARLGLVEVCRDHRVRNDEFFRGIGDVDGQLASLVDSGR